jgi:hypothetical protein
MTVRPFLVVLFVPFLYGAQEKPAGFETFTPKSGGFTVLLPGTPKEQTNRNGMHLYVVDKGKSAYLASYLDVPALAKADEETQKKALVNGRKAAETNLKGKLVSEKSITLDKKYPGLEYLIDTPRGYYRSRTYLVKGRLYQVVVVAPQEEATSKATDELLDSFKLSE